MHKVPCAGPRWCNVMGSNSKLAQNRAVQLNLASQFCFAARIDTKLLLFSRDCVLNHVCSAHLGIFVFPFVRLSLGALSTLYLDSKFVDIHSYTYMNVHTIHWIIYVLSDLAELHDVNLVEKHDSNVYVGWKHNCGVNFVWKSRFPDQCRWKHMSVRSHLTEKRDFGIKLGWQTWLLKSTIFRWSIGQSAKGTLHKPLRPPPVNC